ncbi:MAG: RagB/SusD family nutrient uptake outer membrane protein [Rhodothermaceae bacterium]|nr:RagB/SusD family nutrient uptake outer membrane protein [Rhodothermaceae bacterium]
MNRLFVIFTFLLAGTFVGCDTFVEDTDLPIDSIDDPQLSVETQVEFIVKGVQSRFSTTADRLLVFAGGLSDEFIFDQNVPNATFPSFAEMDIGDITFANNSNDGVYNDLGELRFFADNLLLRIQDIEFEDTALRTEAEFTANLYGGLARYFFATYYGLDKRQGGGIITDDPENPGPFVPSDQMYAQAIAKMEAARALGDAAQARIINTIIARIHLFQGDFASARTSAEAGMIEGDAAFESLHAVDNTNYYWSQAGIGRNQWVTDFRYNAYVEADPAEAARIPLEEVLGNDGTTVYYRQGLYTARESSLPITKWQENELILAELDIRGGDAAGALTRINQVRASHGLAALASADMLVLMDERDKELFTMGLRLPDQRRMDIWHLGPDTWWYLPITQNERNINENI